MRRASNFSLVSKRRTFHYVDTANWILDRPSQIDVVDGNETLHSRKTYAYDTKGNVTQIQERLDIDPLGGAMPRMIIRTTLGYTGSAGIAGQPTTITDARGNTTTLAYNTGSPACDTFGLYPCGITNAANQVTRRTYRLEFGVTTSETDPNGAIVKNEYDRLGRLSRILRPLDFNQDPATLPYPWRRFTYFLGSPGSGGNPATPSRVQTELREPSHASNLRTEQRFYDGLGRPLETKAESIVDGAAETTVREAFGFDAAGRVDRRYAPFASSSGLTQYEVPSGATTTSVFDHLDRITKVTKPDNSAVITKYDPAGTTEIHDENYVGCTDLPGSVANAVCPGKRIVESRDALGRLLNVKVYRGATLDNETVNTYDVLDRLRTTQLGSDVNTKVTFNYDSLGRRIEVMENDSGTWKYGYDDADNLVYQNDPKLNQHLETCVDALNRPSAKYSLPNDSYSGDSCGGGVILATYEYDTCGGGIGRRCSELNPGRHYVGRTYDARGRIRMETRTITASGEQRSFIYNFTYDEADRLKTLQYPTSTDGGLELLTYSFDAAGHLVSAATPGNTYLSGATYDRFGRPKNLSLSGGAVSEVRDYFDATANFRPKQVAVTSTVALQTWNYGPSSQGGVIQNGYDAAGNLLQINDVTPQYEDNSVRDNDWVYTYDGVGRLASAAWRAIPTAAFQYDSIGNMTQGNLAFPNLDATTPVAFAHHGTRRHHLLSMTPSGGSPSLQYESDGASGSGNGGLTSRPATVAGDVGKTISYDVEGRVREVTVGADTVESVYDDQGQRVARVVNDIDLSFFFGRYVEVHGNQLIRHIYAGNRRIAFSPIPAPPNLTLAALADDHPAVMLARAAEEAAWVKTLPPVAPDIGPIAAASGVAILLIGTFVLGIAPGRVRVGILGRVYRGRVAVLVLFYVVTLPEWPSPFERPTRSDRAWADCPDPTPTSYPAYAVHVDHLGSTTLLTAYKVQNESDGAVLQYYRYGPYGRMAVYDRNGAAVSNGSELTDLSYTSQRWDRHSALYDYGARFYDPGIARFASIDPAREYMNPYAYVRWIPTSRIDPSGAVSAQTLAWAWAASPEVAWWYETTGMVGAGQTGSTNFSVGQNGSITTSVGDRGMSMAPGANFQAYANAVGTAAMNYIAFEAEVQGSASSMTVAAPLPLSMGTPHLTPMSTTGLDRADAGGFQYAGAVFVGYSLVAAGALLFSTAAHEFAHPATLSPSLAPLAGIALMHHTLFLATSGVILAGAGGLIIGIGISDTFGPALGLGSFSETVLK